MKVFALEYVKSYFNQFLVPSLPWVFQSPPKDIWLKISFYSLFCPVGWVTLLEVTWLTSLVYVWLWVSHKWEGGGGLSQAHLASCWQHPL